MRLASIIDLRDVLRAKLEEYSTENTRLLHFEKSGSHRCSGALRLSFAFQGSLLFALSADGCQMTGSLFVSRGGI
jgi:hypothetical protein